MKDLVCAHGNFDAANDAKELFVVEAVFEYFKNEFMPNSDVKHYEKNDPRCSTCKDQADSLKEWSDGIKKLKSDEKWNLRHVLGSIANNQPRVFYSDKYVVISATWLRQWEECIDDLESDARPGKINEDLVCQHTGLIVDVNLELCKEKHQRCIYITEVREWENLLKYYPDSIKITYTPQHSSDRYSFTAEINGKTNPAICQSCFEIEEKKKS
jgi:hypothetical protein